MGKVRSLLAVCTRARRPTASVGKCMQKYSRALHLEFKHE